MGCIADDLIACARNRIYDLRAKAARECEDDEVLGTHVLFVIYLPVQTLHSSLVGFQGDPWISAHIDEIRPTNDDTLTLDIAEGVSISKLFYGPLEDDTLGTPSEAPAFTEEFAVSGPAAQQTPSVAGPAAQVITSVAGPTAQVIASVAGPITQMITTIDGSTVQVVTTPTLEGMPVAPPTPLCIPLTEGKKDIPRMYTQCRRLNICIQAAASRLVHLTPNKEWATKRVELLTNLIPSNPDFPISKFSSSAMKYSKLHVLLHFSADEGSFYGIMVKHIHGLLQKRSETYGEKSNWVLSEAMDLRKLHLGGTFKNTLARKLDDVVIPLFAKVIALVDHNYNLRHLKNLRLEQSSVQEFWLRMFSDPNVLQLNYSENVGGEKVPVIDENFKCQLPFSWLIKEAVDNHWELAKTTSGKCILQIIYHQVRVYVFYIPLADKMVDIYNQLCSVFPETPIGEVLSSFDDHYAIDDFLQRYTHDFLRTVHKCEHTNVEKEYKVCEKINDLLYAILYPLFPLFSYSREPL